MLYKNEIFGVGMKLMKFFWSRLLEVGRGYW